ncbi:MAG: DUF333 domain-containing protein [Pseudoruegeria sp.]
MSSKSIGLGTVSALVILIGCAEDVDQVDLSNPAATFCVASNGVYEVREDPEGNAYSVCVFEEGEIDAWELYRKETAGTSQ